MPFRYELTRHLERDDSAKRETGQVIRSLGSEPRDFPDVFRRHFRQVDVRRPLAVESHGLEAIDGLVRTEKIAGCEAPLPA